MSESFQKWKSDRTLFRQNDKIRLQQSELHSKLDCKRLADLFILNSLHSSYDPSKSSHDVEIRLSEIKKFAPNCEWWDFKFIMKDHCKLTFGTDCDVHYIDSYADFPTTWKIKIPID
jgi:hypothetical protein